VTSGAALMLSAVALMAFARWLYHPAGVDGVRRVDGVRPEVSKSEAAHDDASQASEQLSV